MFGCQVIPLRNYLLGYQPPSERKPDPVLATIAQLFRKMYNPRNFKGSECPERLTAPGERERESQRVRVGQLERFPDTREDWKDAECG